MASSGFWRFGRNLFMFLGLGLALYFFFAFSWVVVSPGNTAVIFNIWTGSLRTVGQGLTVRMPLITEVRSYPIALRTYTMARMGDNEKVIRDDSIDLPTKEGQHIRQDISVTYNTSEEQAAQVFKAFRGADIEQIERTFIRRTIITAAQNTAGQMSLSELISNKRYALQEAIQKELELELGKMGFRTDKVNLGASHLPESLELQMQQKMAAQQQAQQAEYELQKQEVLAKAAVARAEGEAQAILVRAKADAEANRMLASTLTQLLVQDKVVERWDGHLPQVTGQGGVPMLTLPPSGKDP